MIFPKRSDHVDKFIKGGRRTERLDTLAEPYWRHPDRGLPNESAYDLDMNNPSPQWCWSPSWGWNSQTGKGMFVSAGAMLNRRYDRVYIEDVWRFVNVAPMNLGLMPYENTNNWASGQGFHVLRWEDVPGEPPWLVFTVDEGFRPGTPLRSRYWTLDTDGQFMVTRRPPDTRPRPSNEANGYDGLYTFPSLYIPLSWPCGRGWGS